MTSPFALSYDERLQFALEDFFRGDPMPFTCDAFFTICDLHDVNPGDLQDAINEAGYRDAESEAHLH